MKTLLLIISLGLQIEHSDEPYSIKIWDANYSLSYTILYIVTNEGLEIKRIGGIKGERDSVLVKRNLSAGECKLVSGFFKGHNVYQLHNTYNNPMIADGDRNRIEIEIGNKVKLISMSNSCQKDIAELFEVINKLITNKKVQIRYRQ